MGDLRDHIVCLMFVLVTAIPLTGEQFNRKALQKIIVKRYEGKIAVVLKSGLDVSYCVRRDQYGNLSVFPVNEDISSGNVTLDKEYPVGVSHGFSAALTNPVGDVKQLGCSGPVQIAVPPGGEVRLEGVDVWARRETPMVELHVETRESRLQERSVLGTNVSSLDQGFANWIFILNPGSDTDISQAAISAIDSWLKSFESAEEASAFASQIKKTVNFPEATSNTATVALVSTPLGVDIFMDGKFFGNTPATLLVAPGDHTISMSQGGYKPWQRTITLTEGSRVTLNAILEKAEP